MNVHDFPRSSKPPESRVLKLCEVMKQMNSLVRIPEMEAADGLRTHAPSHTRGAARVSRCVAVCCGFRSRSAR